MLSKLFMTWAANENFEFYLHIKDTQIRSILDLLFQHSKRIERLFIYSESGQSLYHIFTRLRLLQLPVLQQLEVIFNPSTPHTMSGHLPNIMDDDGLTLRHIHLEGCALDLRKPLGWGLRSLTLSRLPATWSHLSFDQFAEMLLLSPGLKSLSLDGVFPDHVAGDDQIGIQLLELETLELVIPPYYEFTNDLFNIITAPNLRKLKLSSRWEPVWVGLDTAFPVMAAKYPAVRELHFVITCTEGFGDENKIDQSFYMIFPELRVFSIEAFYDPHVMYFLVPWVTAMDDDLVVVGDDHFCLDMIWPHLDLMVIKSDHDNPEEVFIGQPSLQDLIDIIRVTRESVGLPLDIQQDWIFEKLNDVRGVSADRHHGSGRVPSTRDRLVALPSVLRTPQVQTSVGESCTLGQQHPEFVQGSSRTPWVL